MNSNEEHNKIVKPTSEESQSRQNQLISDNPFKDLGQNRIGITNKFNDNDFKKTK